MHKKVYSLIALGGTFDHLHAGHKHFLSHALAAAAQLVIGVTVPEMNASKAYSQLIEPYNKRVSNLKKYLGSFNKPCRIIPLTDIFGETLDNPEIDALAVTTLTQSGAQAVNRERHKRDLQPLPLIVASMLTTSSGDYLSSTLIRSGLIDRSGLAYASLFDTDVRLHEEQKKVLRSPQGLLLKSEAEIDPRQLAQATKVTTVGDMVTQAFLRNRLRVDYSLIDFKTHHETHVWQPQTFWKGPIVTVTNPAGHIQRDAARALFQGTSHNTSLFLVEGEEDLLAIPMVMCLPLGSLLYYGQPNQGIVEVRVTEELKHRFHAFITQTTLHEVLEQHE